ncbi:MAG: Ig-like domain-containing protein [Prevotella sp.]|nr:Ig-like domain-containing protein [Prevotella sp.]
MKKFLRFSLLTLLMTVFNGAWAAEATFTFASGSIPSAGGDFTLNEVTWNASITWKTDGQTYMGYDGTKGLQIGSGSKPASAVVLSTSGISGNITSVKVNASVASQGTTTLDVSVGGTAFGEQVTLQTSATEYTFTGTAATSGVIVISFNQPSTSKAIYVKSITVVTEDSGTEEPVDPTVNISGTSVAAGKTLSISFPNDLDIEFESSDESVATVDVDGVVTGVSEGTADITATWSGDDNYNEGEVTFTVTVTAPVPATTYVKVTNANQLVAGNEFILVATGFNKAMGSQNDKIRNVVDVTLSDDKVSITDEAVAVMTLGGSTGAWTFNTDDGYISYTGSSNQVYVATETSAATDWTVTEDFQLESVNVPGRVLKYNSGSPRFACYATGQQTAVLFVKEGSPINENVPVCTITTDLTELEVGQPIRWEDFTISYAEGLTEDDVDVDYEASSNFFNDLEQGLVPTEEGTATITFTFTYDGEGNYSDVEKTFIFNVVDNRQDPELAFTPNTITIVQGEEFETPVLSSVNDEYFFESGLATVESDNPDVAYWDDENGLQLGDELGTAVITVSYDGNEYSRLDAGYKSGEATLTVTVVDELPTEETATFDATIDLATTGNTAGAWSITKDGLTISADGGIGGNGTDYRIYKNATFTVSSTVGNITKIEFTAESSNPVSGFGTVEGLNGDTWTGNAESVSFTASEKQVRLTLVNITYEPNGEAPTTPICTMTQLLTNLELGKIYDIYELVQVEEAEGADPSKISRGIGGYGDSFDYIGGKYKADKEGPAQMTLTWEYFPGEGNENPYSKVEETFYFTIAEPVEYQFDFNAIENLPTSSTSSTDGDITSDLTIEEDGVTLVISPSTSSTPNRWWSTNNGPQLRVYGGTLTFSSEENISKIELYNTKWNDDNSADSGELTNSGSVATWTGSAKTVVITIAGNTQLDKVVVEKAVEVVPVTISASGKATLYYAEKTLKVAEGVTAYTAVKGVSTITLTALEDGIIPAGVPVVVSGTEGSYEFEVMTNSTASFEGQNDLVGVEVDTKDEEAGYKYYVLSWKNKNKNPEEVGFYWQAGSKGLWANVKAHQAYMKVPEGVAPSDANGFSFTFDETTGITTIDGDSTLDMNAPMYNLSGQRVDNSYRGVVIQNGKKVIKK